MADADDGSCVYGGCTDPSADNFDPNASVYDGTCLFFGCTDPSAENFDPLANANDDSCDYLDLCGVCGGDGSSCSACDADVCLWIEDNSIYYATDLDITGFQFNFSCDASPTVCCGPAGWTVVAGTVAIVGFELTLNTITGSGILFSYTDGACFEFEEIILADAQGNPIESIQLGWE